MFAKKISESFVEKFRHETPPWGPIGYVTYKRTYARRLETGGTEEFWQTLQRSCNGLLELGAPFTQDDIQELFSYMFNLKGIVSGRALWQLGTDTVRKVGGDSLINCWFVACNEVEAFKFTMNELMLGGGVGFSIMPEEVYQLPPVRFKPKIIRTDSFDCDFIITDNREGWVEFLGRVLDSFYYTGKDLYYCTKAIRPRGAYIKGFGGTASGPEDLVIGVDQIVKILTARFGQHLKPVDVLDIQNLLGQIVVAGNVRRSAELSIGDARDKDYIFAKNWTKHQVPKWRQNSNNSVLANEFDDVPSEFWNGYNGEGEPYGLVNLRNHQRYGRLADGLDYRPDYKVKGVNPCSEISLEPFECCNLAEIFLPNLRDTEEFKKVARVLYMAQKSISAMRYSHPKTNEVIKRNMRLGLGITGYLQSEFEGDESAFTSVYKYLEQYDEYFSGVLGVNKSIKLTTVKPSGTLSLLAGVTPGCHPAYADYYIRRIRFASDDPIVEACRENGYHVEPKVNFDGTNDLSTMVVSFPVKSDDRAVTNAETTAVKQLEVLKFLQTYWADNSVSITVYYKQEELPDIQRWLSENYDSDIKSVSFLLHSGHGFTQAPYEQITAERYMQELDQVKPLKSLGESNSLSSDSLECAGGQCPVR
jgi:adenosylcobalamin-dependent ribonucleoside-triphosphate reductase